MSPSATWSVPRTESGHRFSHAYRTTLGADFTTKTVVLPSPPASSSSSSSHVPPPRTVRLQIWDTAGAERFRALGSAFYRGADACVLMYSSTDRGSLEGLKAWMDEFGEKRPVTEEEEASFVWVAVGCKQDLVDEVAAAKGAENAENGDSRPGPPEDAWKSHDSLGHVDVVTESQAQEFLKTLLPPPVEPDPSGGPIPFLIPPGYTRAEARSELQREMPAHPKGFNRTPPQGSRNRLHESEEEHTPPSTPPKMTPARARKVSMATASEITLSIYHTPPSTLRKRGRGKSSNSFDSFDYDDEYDDDDDAASVKTVTPDQSTTGLEPPPSRTDIESAGLDEEPPTQDPPPIGTSLPLPPPAEAVDSEGVPLPPSESTKEPQVVTSPDPPPPLDTRTFPLFLTSSLTGHNVDALFTYLASACAAREELERIRLEEDADARSADEERKRAEVHLREVENNKSLWKRCCGS